MSAPPPGPHASSAAAPAAGTSGRSIAVAPALRAELDALYADHAAALDDGRYDDWVDLFVDDCAYLLQPRENFDRGLPLATLAFESKGMLRDRVYGITRTLFHAPYYQRHVIGPLRVLSVWSVDGVETLEVQAPYAVFRTRVHEPSEVFNVGRSIDRVVRDPADARLRFARRHVVFDSELIPNSIVYPI